jgi:anti-sigma factor RsiW
MDEELSVEEMRRVAAHLEECRPCESGLRLLQQTRALMGKLPDARPREAFWRDAYDRLWREGRRPMPWWQRLSVAQRSAVIAAPALVAASLAAALFFPQIAGNGDAPVGPPDTVAQPAETFDPMTDLLQAHLEARTSLPLTDQGHVRLLLVDSEGGD